MRRGISQFRENGIYEGSEKCSFMKDERIPDGGAGGKPRALSKAGMSSKTGESRTLVDIGFSPTAAGEPLQTAFAWRMPGRH